MPRVYKQSQHLWTKKFRNKRSVIEIVFYDHEMAEPNVKRKRKGRCYRRGRWRNARRLAYIPFDTCKEESIYDYNDCLDVLRRDKVARRWFIREMRHCTKNLILPNGKIDMENIRVVFNTPEEWRLDLFIEDNDYVLYVKP